MITVKTIKEKGTPTELEMLRCGKPLYAISPDDSVYSIELEEDDYPGSPREFDHIGIMVSIRGNWAIGDTAEGDLIFKDRTEAQAFVASIKEDPDKYLALPVYMYEHSGQTISLKPFGCRWDSGICGYIYGTKEKAIAELGADESCWKEKLQEALENEIELYDDYLTGNVYGVKLYRKEEVEHVVKRTGKTWTETEEVEVESCCGFYGYDHRKSGLLDFVQENLPEGTKYYSL